MPVPPVLAAIKKPKCCHICGAEAVTELAWYVWAVIADTGGDWLHIP